MTEVKIGSEEVKTAAVPGYEGETSKYLVTWSQGSDGKWTITNQRKPDTSITLKKVDKKDVNKQSLAESDLLDGAKFKIVKYKTLDPLDEDTVWNTSGDNSKEQSGDNGLFTFDGLTPGIYMIEETECPAGYIRLTDNPIIRVNNDLSIDLLDSEGKAVAGNSTDLVKLTSSDATIIIGNEPGMELPHTGGSGIRIFTILGSMLILAAGILLWRRRRLI